MIQVHQCPPHPPPPLAFIHWHSFIQRLLSAKPYPFACLLRRELAARMGRGIGSQLASNSGFMLSPSTVPYMRPLASNSWQGTCPAATAPSGLGRSGECTHPPSSQALPCSFPGRTPPQVGSRHSELASYSTSQWHLTVLINSYLLRMFYFLASGISHSWFFFRPQWLLLLSLLWQYSSTSWSRVQSPDLSSHCTHPTGLSYSLTSLHKF